MDVDEDIFWVGFPGQKPVLRQTKQRICSNLRLRIFADIIDL